MNRIKLVSIIVVIVISIFMFLFAVNFINDSGKIKMSIIVAPKDASITIDGKAANYGANYVLPGKHKIAAKRQHFNSLEYTVNISRTNTSVPPMGLRPIDTTGLSIEKASQADYMDVDGEGSKQYDQAAEKLHSKYPILGHLPKSILSRFRIDFGVSKKYPNDPLKIAIYISANSAQTRQNALYYIYVMGYDPSDYEIIFRPLDLSNL